MSVCVRERQKEYELKSRSRQQRTLIEIREFPIFVRFHFVWIRIAWCAHETQYSHFNLCPWHRNRVVKVVKNVFYNISFFFFASECTSNCLRHKRIEQKKKSRKQKISSILIVSLWQMKLSFVFWLSFISTWKMFRILAWFFWFFFSRLFISVWFKTENTSKKKKKENVTLIFHRFQLACTIRLLIGRFPFVWMQHNVYKCNVKKKWSHKITIIKFMVNLLMHISLFFASFIHANNSRQCARLHSLKRFR